MLFCFCLWAELIKLLMLYRKSFCSYMHFLPKPIFTGSTRLRAYHKGHKGIFSIDFVESNSMQNRKALPLLFFTCYCEKSPGKRDKAEYFVLVALYCCLRHSSSIIYAKWKYSESFELDLECFQRLLYSVRPVEKIGILFLRPLHTLCLFYQLISPL